MPEGKHDHRRDKAKRIEQLVTVAPRSLGDYALRYLDDLRIRNYSHHTIRGSRTYLRLFLVWCEERGLSDPREVTLSVLRRYQSHLFHFEKKDGHRISCCSQCDRLAGVRRFFTWMEDQGHLAVSPAVKLHLPRVEKRLPRNVLTAEEAEAVLAQPDVTTLQGLRDRALLETLYATGLRRQEMEALLVSDVDFGAAVIVVRRGKGKKDRLIPLSERAAAWIVKYLEEARPQLLHGRDCEHLFMGRWGRSLKGGQMSKLVRTYLAASGVPKTGSCHVFRHTMATLMLEGGADLRYVQKMLGHTTIATTEIYTHVAIRRLKEVHAASHPGARLSRRQRHQLAAGDPQEALLSLLAAEEAEEAAEGAATVDVDG